MTSALTTEEISNIVWWERACASLSVAGVLAVFVLFGCYRRLRNVPNLFIVFASVANLGASAASLIGYSGVVAGADSSLCQAQAFLFELFMQSDPWWSLAMAINVYMVFFHAADPSTFGRYWYWYCLVCYGIPLIPAVTLLCVRDGYRGEAYGDATIWCWIGKDWSHMRIWTYYLPIWACIVLSVAIYAAVGHRVFRQRSELRRLMERSAEQIPRRDSVEQDLTIYGSVMSAGLGPADTDGVQIVTSVGCRSESPARPDSGREVAKAVPGLNMYSTYFERSVDQQQTSTVTRISASRPATEHGQGKRIRPQAQRGWGHVGSGLTKPAIFRKLDKMDPVKLAYLRTSVVFACSVLVTWTPSSINRLHDLFRPDQASYRLNLLSAIVLPLQGFWNAVIFCFTSRDQLRLSLRSFRDRVRGLPRGHHAAEAARLERMRQLHLERHLRPRPPPRHHTHDHTADDDDIAVAANATDCQPCVDVWKPLG